MILLRAPKFQINRTQSRRNKPEVENIHHAGEVDTSLAGVEASGTARVRLETKYLYYQPEI